MKNIFHELSLTANPEIKGTKNDQISSFVGNSNESSSRIDTYQTWQKDLKNLDLHKFKMESTARITQFISSRYLRLNGFFLNKICKNKLKKFSLDHACFFSSTAFQGGDPIEMFFLNIPHTKLIDYSKSSFTLDEMIPAFRTGGQPVNIKSYTDHLLKADQQVKKDAMISILPLKMFLIKETDIFRLPASNKIYVSDKIKAAFDESSGAVFNQCKVDFKFT